MLSEFGAHGARYLREVIRRTGRTIAGHAVWTMAEDKIVRKYFPDYRKIETVLRFRSIQSIRRRSIELGVAPRQNMWTTSEIARFKKLCPTTDWPELLVAFPRRTKRALAGRAKKLRIRKKRPYISSGYPVVDAIIARARELNLTMPDLDEMARSKGYFTKAAWRCAKGLNGRAVCRAVEALDGDIAVVWR